MLEGVEMLNPISGLEDLNGFKMSVRNLSSIITPNLFHTDLKHVSGKVSTSHLQIRP